MIDISGIDKAVLYHHLSQGQIPLDLARTTLEKNNNCVEVHAIIIDLQDHSARPTTLVIDLSGDQFDETTYDQCLSSGAAKTVVEVARLEDSLRSMIFDLVGMTPEKLMGLE